ncbi:hypothetical protein HK097_005378 [Rhizophlyctis rosea]|uniref:Uncharacterized protein n=1 Tax=Rhizophlyctis rosea TaxID=64517 RepID=A0AAD5S1Y1_9FUNG|nr:hypothetical protein HK097_005378 [Rhizophlyctis rosea]
MVAFKKLLLSLFVSTAMVQAALTPAQIVQNIETLTSKSQALQAPAQTISILNGPLIIIGQGPFPVYNCLFLRIIAGFTDIIQTATTAIAAMKGSAPVPAGPDASLIFEAFREFVRVHQALLNILIGKAGLLSTIPFFGEPVAAVLRQVEQIVDTIAFALIDQVESRSADLNRENGSLQATIRTAIRSYEGLKLGRRATTETLTRRSRRNKRGIIAA